MKIVFEGTPEQVLAEMSKIASANGALLHTVEHPKGEPKAKTKARAKKAAPKVEEPEVNEPPQPEEEKPKRARRKRGEAATASAGEGKADAPARRSRRAPKEEGEVTISDADLSLAASNAAQVILPKGVTAILEEFGVDDVSKLEGDQRQEFLDQTKEAINNG
jgi:hypothetical protein